MNDWLIQMIHNEAETIRQKIFRDGQISTLFGEPLDPQDLDSMIVAAYHFAKQEEMERQRGLHPTW